MAAGTLPTTLRSDDPKQLLTEAGRIKTTRIDQPVNTLEYWGPDVKAQIALRPAVERRQKLLERAAALAQKRADDIAATMRGATDSVHLRQWKQYDALAKQANYELAMNAYDAVLAADPSDVNRLAEIAVARLQKWDIAGSPVQQLVQLQLGKVLLADGQSQRARRIFQAISPKAEVALQFQAGFFLTLCNLQQGNIAAAEKDLADLRTWQNQNLPAANPAWRNGASAAISILQYRIDCAQADQSSVQNEKTKYNQLAVAALHQLADRQPDLKPAILEHLGEHFAGMQDVSHADPLLLEALMQRASNPDADSATLAVSLRAAQTVLHRSNEFDVQTVDYAAAISAAILDKTNQSTEAAKTYLMLAKRLKDRNPKTAAQAIERAVELFAEDPSQIASYAQSLKIAVAPPFDRTALLYAYGVVLAQQHEYSKAAGVLERVPSNDPHHADARLELMLCLQKLMQGADDATQSRLSQRIDHLADTLKDTPLKQEAFLLAAEVSTQRHQPQAALERLKDIDTEKAAELRVAAWVELNQPVQAADVLAKLQTPNLQIANKLLTLISDDLERTTNPDQARPLVQARLRVIKRLLDWTPNPSRELPLAYADALRRAGELETNHDLKIQDLQNALSIYRHFVNAGDKDDPHLLLGEAAARFDLGDYTAARDSLLKLLSSGQLGDGQHGNADDYWEATYKLLAGNAALADEGKATSDQKAQNIAYLKRLYIQWGNQIGGKKWHSSFEKLRQKIAPEFTPDQ